MIAFIAEPRVAGHAHSQLQLAPTSNCSDARKTVTSNIAVIITVYNTHTHTHTHTHTRPFNGPLSGTTLVSRYLKGKTNLDFTEARDSEWHWHQLGHMLQVCTSFQTDNHGSTLPLTFLQAGCPSCRPTNSVKALKATLPYIMCSEYVDNELQRL